MNSLVYKEKGPALVLFAVFMLAIGVAAFTQQYLVALIPFVFLLFIAGWQHKKLLFYLLLVTLPFSFEYQFSSGLGTDIPDEFLMLLVAFVFLSYWIFYPAAINRRMISHPLFIVLIVILCWILVTTIFSTDPQLSVKYLLAKCWYIGAFVLAPLVLFSNKQSIILGGKLLAGAMFLVTAIILFRHYDEGLGFATINDAVYPFFRNHVNYSAMLVCLLPLLVVFLVLAPKGSSKWWLAIATGITLFALAFSYARGAWLALLVGVIAFGLLRKGWMLFAYILVLVLIVSSVFWLKSNDRYVAYASDYRTTIFQKDFGKHLVATYKLKDMSTVERFYRWIAGIRMIKDNSLTGYGPNTFYDNYKSYTIPAYKTWVSDNPERSTVHNYFLLTVIEQGWPGLFFLVVLLGMMLFYAQRLYHRITDRNYKAIAGTISVMIPMIIALNFFSDLIETDKIGSLFFLCLATLIAVDLNTKQRSDLSPNVQSVP